MLIVLFFSLFVKYKTVDHYDWTVHFTEARLTIYANYTESIWNTTKRKQLIAVPINVIYYLARVPQLRCARLNTSKTPAEDLWISEGNPATNSGEWNKQLFSLGPQFINHTLDNNPIIPYTFPPQLCY